MSFIETLKQNGTYDTFVRTLVVGGICPETMGLKPPTEEDCEKSSCMECLKRAIASCEKE